jgi:hypothetical protein
MWFFINGILPPIFDIESGQMSVVVQNELYGEGSSRLDILEIADWRWVTSRDPRSLVIFHDAQLSAAQAAPLQQGSSETQKTYYDQKPSGPNKPSGYRYEWGFVGTLIIGLGAALLRLSMELLYKADEAKRFSFAGWATFAISGAMIVHGLIYACGGMNGIRNLYFF